MSHCGLQLVVTSSCVLVKMNLVVTSSCVLVKMKTVLCTLHQSLTVDEESLAARGAAEFLPGHSALSGSLSIIIIVVVGLLNSTEAPAGGIKSRFGPSNSGPASALGTFPRIQYLSKHRRDFSAGDGPARTGRWAASSGRPRVLPPRRPSTSALSACQHPEPGAAVPRTPERCWLRPEPVPPGPDACQHHDHAA
ncbi:uncharacterized protein LOC118319324 isoform X3 [Scophthalmus maximus]|uniref:uncharacterized protein LOC118319324 isoform X3 n=1 Tax=Scophthalmus maximus TaxID=52904 RepID=UPI001FA90662|nr:uncharacterized protein LOC118319324 isoform X3 [Scophthalmus maximus]